MGASPVFWKSLNADWPKPMGKPTDEAAISGARRLYKFGTGYLGTERVWPGKVEVVRGSHRHTWARWTGGAHQRKVLQVGVDKGWRGIVHGLSHYIHRYERGYRKPHDSRQARLEKALQQYVIENLL